MSRTQYPATVAECLDSSKRFKRATHKALRRFARSRPWRGTFDERARKFTTLHADLVRVYSIECGLTIAIPRERDGAGATGRSCFVPLERRIYLTGRLSVVTYLHEFGHALGYGERGACRWSINLFARHFPNSFARCSQVGHLLVRS